MIAQVGRTLRLHAAHPWLAAFPDACPRWMLAAASLQALLLFAASAWRYNHWYATAMDLGFFEQALWKLSHGDLAAVTTVFLNRPVLADHFSLLLYALALPYRFLGGAYFLFATQALAAACCGLTLYRLALTRTADRQASTWLYGLYWLYPWVFYGVLFDFHPDVLGMLTLALFLLAVERGQPRAAYGWAGAAMISKDYVAALILLYGLLAALKGGQRRLGLGLAAMAAAYAGFVYGVALPLLSPAGAAIHANELPALSGTPWHTAPALLWQAAQRSAFAVWLLAPLGFLPLLAWQSLPGLFLLAVNLVSPVADLRLPVNQYALLPLPFLFLGAAAVWPKRVGKGASRLVGATLLTVCLVLLAEPRTLLTRTFAAPAAGLDQAVRLIPPDAPLYGGNWTLAHFANRAQLRLFAVPDGGRTVAITCLDATTRPAYLLLTTDATPHLASYIARANIAYAASQVPAAQGLLASGGVYLVRLPALARPLAVTPPAPRVGVFPAWFGAATGGRLRTSGPMDRWDVAATGAGPLFRSEPFVLERGSYVVTAMLANTGASGGILRVTGAAGETLDVKAFGGAAAPGPDSALRPAVRFELADATPVVVDVTAKGGGVVLQRIELRVASTVGDAGLAPKNAKSARTTCPP